MKSTLNWTKKPFGSMKKMNIKELPVFENDKDKSDFYLKTIDLTPGYIDPLDNLFNTDENKNSNFKSITIPTYTNFNFNTEEDIRPGTTKTTYKQQLRSLVNSADVSNKRCYT